MSSSRAIGRALASGNRKAFLVPLETDNRIHQLSRQFVGEVSTFAGQRISQKQRYNCKIARSCGHRDGHFGRITSVNDTMYFCK
jgi:hypothetical protein